MSNLFKIKRWFVCVLWKNLFCSWAHRHDRCYPEVWKEELTYWHCAKCWPCYMELEEILKGRKK